MERNGENGELAMSEKKSNFGSEFDETRDENYGEILEENPDPITGTPGSHSVSEASRDAYNQIRGQRENVEKE